MKRLLFVILLLVFCVEVFAATNRVLLMVIPGCKYCAEAKTILNRKRIPYQTQIAKEGPVPRLYINGKLQGTGLDAVASWAATQPSAPQR